MRRFFPKLKQAAWLSAALVMAPTAQADIASTPVIGGMINSSAILKDQVFGGLQFSTRATRDLTLFTVAGLSLDSYILTLPLDAKVKARVVGQLSNPAYAIPLGYFLHTFYDRYTGSDARIVEGDQFKAYLQTQYSQAQLAQWQHDLFSLDDGSQASTTTEETATAEKLEDTSHHHNGLTVNREMIAALVVVYDALVEIDDWRKQDYLPDHYRYLSNSPEDKALVAKIQPIVIGFFEQLAPTLAPGDTRAAIETVIADHAPDAQNKVNNKAQAVTITLIDFVRLNVLKNYRQFSMSQTRIDTYGDWLEAQFDDNPQQLVAFLTARVNRPLAVQIVVDGLQQGMMEGLVTPGHPYLQTAYGDHLAGLKRAQQFSPANPPSGEQHRTWLKALASDPKAHQALLADKHYLPFFKALYRDYEPAIVDIGVASTPTISVRNLPIVKTGAAVAGAQGTGIPNFHFVARDEDRAYYFFGNDALALDKLLAQNKVPTMFERLDHLTTLNCNAQYDWHAHVSYDGLVNLGLGEAMRDYGEKRCVRELSMRSQVEQKAQALRLQLIDDIRQYQQIHGIWFYTKVTLGWRIEENLRQLAALSEQGMPDFTLIYNPWPDHFAHFTGPLADEIIAPTGELNRLDYWLSQITAVYQEAGVYSRTLWGMAGDHGLAPVYHTLNPEITVFEQLKARYGHEIVVKKISSDEGEGPKITHALNPPSMQNIDVVVASTAGGNLMFDFFNARQGWAVQPVYQDLIAWRPQAAPADFAIDLVDEISTQLADSLDYLALRQSHCDTQVCQVRLVGYRDGKRRDELVMRQGERLYYGVLSLSTAKANAVTFAKDKSPILLALREANPYLPQPTAVQLRARDAELDRCLVKADPAQPNTWCDSQSWRELTRYSAKPDAVNQIAQLYAEDRAGTINLFPQAGIGFNTKVPGRHAGEHYLEKDAFLGFWGAPLGNAIQPIGIAENGSLAPTLYEYLTGECVQVGKHHWGYPSLLQYLSISPMNVDSH
ncbi:hypothetical protein VST7929_00948 [Vibrio stylophorae]|uniref:Nucleotide pyrophosphatase n=1 Tax=Vibrio stylophorae TaxID=659351 RepID=A0ABM8ZT63_9VIBR|nr:alkaline phosphatase family protein [Vibrio stylophorae]CAH0533095.1 hypothetical protein VST7929_00948 [Vibrio stylophorae]